MPTRDRKRKERERAARKDTSQTVLSFTKTPTKRIIVPRRTPEDVYILIYKQTQEMKRLVKKIKANLGI